MSQDYGLSECPTSRLGFIRLALAQRCRYEHDWSLSRWARMRLTAKFVVCALLLPERRVYCAYPLDHVEVANFGGTTWSSPDGTFSHWDILAVGRGWRNWRWEAASDGN